MEPSLADQCLAAARSHEPADATTWEAMGALAGFGARGAPHALTIDTLLNLLLCSSNMYLLCCLTQLLAFAQYVK